MEQPEQLLDLGVGVPRDHLDAGTRRRNQASLRAGKNRRIVLNYCTNQRDDCRNNLRVKNVADFAARVKCRFLHINQWLVGYLLIQVRVLQSVSGS